MPADKDNNRPPIAAFLRRLAATLMCSAGLALVAALWTRDLTQLAVLDALIGAVYLIAGIGLFGKSRFSLFMGIVIPAIVSISLYQSLAAPEQIHLLRFASDAVIALLCLIVLWQVRKIPTH